MDHLSTPSDCKHDLPDVPYLSTEEYDEGMSAGVFGHSWYPGRKGWKREELRCRKAWDAGYRCDDADCHIHHCECERSHSVEENAAFLQTWLFFGLLKVFLGRKFQTSDFIRLNYASQKVLTTSKLPSLVDEWAVDFKRLPEQNRHGIEYHLDYVLSNAHEIYVYICQSSTINPQVLLSIGLLGETLVGAVNANTNVTVLEYDIWKHNTRLDINVVTNDLTSRMLSHGWCPADLQRLGWFSLTGVWFISNMGSYRGGLVHQECQTNNCKHLRDYLKDYVTRHAQPGCNCDTVCARGSRLTSILTQRLVPLVVPNTTSGETDDCVRLIEASSDSKYVAISHVWADGLGSTSNGIPRCQYQKLSSLVKSLYEGQETDVCFWIDTLACPVAPRESKNMALELMGQTYKKADKVLVLDSSLLGLEHRKMEHKEIVMRIYLSTWIRRLWTYQEGIFAKSLYFQFADGAWEFDAAEKTTHAQALFSADSSSGLMLGHHFKQIRDRRLRQAGNYLENLQVVAHGLRARSTSKQSDEPICLASLLDLDLGPIVKSEEADRMKAFWSAMPLYDRELVFWPGNCLAERGYRWAPSTFIDSHLDDFLPPLPADAPEERLARRTPEGLMFQGPGIVLGRISTELNHVVVLRDATPPSLEFPFVVILYYPLRIYSANSEIALILHKPLTASTELRDPVSVILTSITRNEGDVLYGTTLTIGLLCGRDSPRADGVMNEASRMRKEVYHQLFIFAALRMMNEGLSVEEALEETDLADILVDGKHGAFDLKTLPDNQKWCVERDVNWRHPLHHER